MMGGGEFQGPRKGNNYEDLLSVSNDYSFRRRGGGEKRALRIDLEKKEKAIVDDRR